MRTISTGEPSTLGTYLKIGEALHADRFVYFIKSKIDESENGEKEEVIADESQMMFLLSTML